MSATTAALALGSVGERRSRVVERVVERRGSPCVERAGAPSAGCARLARLLARVCERRRELCVQLVTAPARPRLPVKAADTTADIGRRVPVATTTPGAAAPAPRQQGDAGDGRRPRPRPEGGAGAPGGSGGGGSAPPAGGGGAGGGGSSSPEPTPTPGRSPADAVIAALDRAVDGVNGAADELGLGRPVPDLPGGLPRVPVPLR